MLVQPGRGSQLRLQCWMQQGLGLEQQLLQGLSTWLPAGGEDCCHALTRSLLWEAAVG